MGLNTNVPDGLYSNRLAREHRKRLWWTAYVLDWTCCSKLGHPASIADKDIIVDYPSSDNLEGSTDFEHVEYTLKSIELAGLSQQTRQQLYSRRKHHVLRAHCKSWTDPSINPRTSLPESALTLAETCIQCSRHSYRLLSEAWIHGSFAIVDYFYTQYLFSAATNLALSSLLGSAQSQSDGDNFNTAADIIRQLSQSGNFAAKEFLEHLDAMEGSIGKVRSNSLIQNLAPRIPVVNDEDSLPFTAPVMTAGMALAEPSLQEFLAETDLAISDIDNPSFDPLQTPYWPGIWGGDEWASG